MSGINTAPDRYQVGGSLKVDALSYIVRQADRQLYSALDAGEFCYAFNARQMGKSSLRVQTKHRLQQAGYSCASVDITNIGSETVTPQQWYKGIAAELWRSFNLLGKVNFKQWWEEQAGLSPVQQLSLFIEEIVLTQVPGDKIFIFIDEIDSVLSLDFPLDDFFALIRYCYNQRVDRPKYNRLTFALFGVATPSDLIQDRHRTPFNIGKAIELQGFQLEESYPLTAGLASVVPDPEAAIAEILDWTGGQPFLTQKICRLVVQTAQNPNPLSITKLVRERVISNWQAKDEPEHLKTIRDRLLRNEQQAGALLGIYQQILQCGSVIADEFPEQVELLLSGLAVKSEDKLKVRNPIYQAVFDLAWVDRQFSNLRPYGEDFKGWLKSDRQDPSRLLQGQTLKDARAWSQGKSLSQLDYEFLAASEALDRQEVQQALEAERAIEAEARLAEQTQRLAQEQRNTRLQRLLLLAIGAAFLISTGLGIFAFWQSRRATQSEVEAIATTSDSLFALDKHLESLVQALKAQQRSQIIGGIAPEIQKRVRTALLQAVYGVDEYNRLLGEFAVAFKPDGSLIATSKDNVVKLWRRDGKLEKSLAGHRAVVWGLAFSPDGKMLASASEDKTARIWKLDGTGVTVLSGHTAALRAVTFSPDSQFIATGSDDGTVKLWKPDGAIAATLKQHQAPVWGIAFSPDGKVLASASDDKTIQLWSLELGRAKLLQTLFGHENFVRGVTFSPDGKILVSASDDETIHFWRRSGSGKFAAKPYTSIIGHNAAVSQAVFSPNGRTLASVSWDGTIKLWSVKDGALLKVFPGHTQRVWDVAFSPDGKDLATAGGVEGIVRLWHLQNPASITLSDHKAVVLQAIFSPDGQMAASGSDDRTVKLWKPNGEGIATLKGHQAGVLGVAFSPDSQMLASASWDGTVKLWHIDRQSQRYSLLKTLIGRCGPNWKVAFSADGQKLAVTCQSGAIAVWSKNGTLLKTLVGHSGEARSVAFSSDTIASASLDKNIRLWRSNGISSKTLHRFANGVTATAFSPNGRQVAAGGFDKDITIWNLDGSLFKTFIGHTAEVRSIAFKQDGGAIASASADGTIKLWQMDGTELTTLKGHTNAVWSVAFSPDGRWLVTASEDGTVKLWNVDLALNSQQALIQGCNWTRNYLLYGSDASANSSVRHSCN
jgi:WD40 repeat protein